MALIGFAGLALIMSWGFMLLGGAHSRRSDGPLIGTGAATLLFFVWATVAYVLTVQHPCHGVAHGRLMTSGVVAAAGALLPALGYFGVGRLLYRQHGTMAVIAVITLLPLTIYGVLALLLVANTGGCGFGD
jgi:hypothetical protein